MTHNIDAIKNAAPTFLGHRSTTDAAILELDARLTALEAETQRLKDKIAILEARVGK